MTASLSTSSGWPTRPAARALALAASVAVAVSASAPRRAHADAPERTSTDYDGRAPAKKGAVEALRWIPRLVLFPFYVVVEYGLREPLGATTRAIENNHIADRLAPVIHPKQTLTIAPTLFLDLGFLQTNTTTIPTGGIYFGWDHALVENNQIRIHASTGGPEYWFFSFSDRLKLSTEAEAHLRTQFLERADWQYYGIGADSQQHALQHFDWSRAETVLGFSHGGPAHVGLGVDVGVRSNWFGEPRLVAVDAYGLPGYFDYTTAFARAQAWVDTRDAKHPNETGARLGGVLDYNMDVSHPLARRWLSYRVEGSLFWEVMSPGRVLELRGISLFADPLGGERVPFVDLASLGGSETMRGWYIGRFRGDSAIDLSAAYRYPIWHSLDGLIFSEAGNAFGPHLDGFDVRKLHGSFGMGVSTGTRDSSLELLVAAGTTRFDQDFGIENIRIAIGVNTIP